MFQKSVFTMSQSLSSLLEVSIDFDQSHLFFPTLVITLTALMAIWLLLANFKRVAARVKSGDARLALLDQNADKLRFFGTLVLVVVYFWSMDVVGQLFPNTGMGFLLTSIPFMFLLSLLYVHGITRRVLLGIGLNSIIAPLAAWYLLGQLFAITLP